MTLFYIPAFKNGKLLAILKLAFNNNKDIRFYICNLQNLENESVNKLHFNDTVNMSLNAYEIVNSGNIIDSNIKKIVKNRIALAFKELLGLNVEESNIEIDYAILDLLSAGQWQNIIDAFE